MELHLPDDITLSHKAIYELKAVLEKDIGYQALAEMDEKDIHDFGVFVLTLTATALHKKMRERSIESKKN